MKMTTMMFAMMMMMMMTKEEDGLITSSYCGIVSSPTCEIGSMGKWKPTMSKFLDAPCGATYWLEKPKGK